MSDSIQLEVQPLGPMIGAEVAGVNLATLDDAGFAAIERAWHAHLVLRLRGQCLTDRELSGSARPGSGDPFFFGRVRAQPGGRTNRRIHGSFDG